MESSMRPEGDNGESPPPWTGVLRASGKRFRRQFNPNDWESSILTIRHNVLCLGMSYPCVEKVIANYTGKNKKIFHSAPSVERSVELVKKNLLNQIDGRDLARVVALEANNDILAYTVSKEQGAFYDQRHLNADFNSRTLINQMYWRWGSTVRFRQVILDYFWSPSGSWAMAHWQRSFFNENIPRFVTEGVFNFGDLENDSCLVSALEANTTEDFISSTAAVVYLPFSSHCLSQVVACYDTLSQFYTISFLRKDQLDEHTLWKATNTISPESMSSYLAKTIDQEEIYCTLDAWKIKHCAGDATVTKENIMDVFNRIDRSNEVRMIKLTALRKFHPDYFKSDIRLVRPTLGLNKGGYVGLLSNDPVIQKKVEGSAFVAAMGEQTKPSDIPRKRSISQLQLDKLRVPKKMSKKSTMKLAALRKFHPGYSKSEMQQKKLSEMPRKRSLSHQHLDKLVRPKKMPRKSSLSQYQLDKLIEPKKMPKRRNLSHHQLDKLDEPKKMPMKRSLSHHQLEKLAEPKKMSRRSISYHQLDKLGSGKREKRDDMNVHQNSEKYVRFSAFDNISLPTESLKEPPTLTGIALEWDKILTSFELDYANRSNFGTDHGPHRTSINCLEKGRETIHRIEDANPVNSSKSLGLYEVPTVQEKNKKTDDINSPVASETAYTTQGRQVLGTNKTPPTSEPANSAEMDPPYTPEAMMKIAKLRRIKQAALFAEMSLAKDGTETQDVGQPDALPREQLPQNRGVSPNVNDVFMGANRHTHTGNAQFFNALSMCAHHFPAVADCFIDAMKSLEPPGRFLGRDKTNDTWACIDYDTAIILVPHLLDSYKLNSCCYSSPNIDRSCEFLSAVHRSFDVKFNRGDSSGQFNQLEDASPGVLHYNKSHCPCPLGIVDTDTNEFCCAESSIIRATSFKFDFAEKNNTVREDCDSNKEIVSSITEG